MHITGNLCKTFFNHVFGEYDKTIALKEKTRLSCEEFQVHPTLWVGEQVCIFLYLIMKINIGSCVKMPRQHVHNLI